MERRWSYASWTAPSHYNLLMMPYTNLRKTFASDSYARDFLKFNERLGAEGLEFKSFICSTRAPPSFDGVSLLKLGNVHAV